MLIKRGFSWWSVRCACRIIAQRGLWNWRIYYSFILKEGAWVATRGPMGEAPREWAQPCRWRPEKEWIPVSKCLYCGSGWSTKANSTMGVLLSCLNAPRSQSGKSKKLGLWDIFIMMVHLVTLVRCSQPVCGDVTKASGKCEALKMYRTTFYIFLPIAPHRTSSTILQAWNISHQSKQSCFVPDFMEKAFGLSRLNMRLAIGVFCKGFLSGWESILLFIFEGFLKNICWVCSNVYFASIKLILFFFYT